MAMVSVPSSTPLPSAVAEAAEEPDAAEDAAEDELSVPGEAGAGVVEVSVPGEDLEPEPHAQSETTIVKTRIAVRIFFISVSFHSIDKNRKKIMPRTLPIDGTSAATETVKSHTSQKGHTRDPTLSNQ